VYDIEMRSTAFVLALGLALGLAACSGDQPPDAPNTCTGAVYDLCRDEHDCTVANCRPFGTIQVCTQACTDQMPCPAEENGDAVPCTNGFCVPAAANNCKLP
jgi:hypothetical protein